MVAKPDTETFYRIIFKCVICKDITQAEVYVSGVDRLTQYPLSYHFKGTDMNRRAGMAGRSKYGQKNAEFGNICCNVRAKGKLVKGTIKEDHACDPSCIDATGANCVCACGGKNHGGGLVAAIRYRQVTQ